MVLRQQNFLHNQKENYRVLFCENLPYKENQYTVQHRDLFLETRIGPVS